MKKILFALALLVSCYDFENYFEKEEVCNEGSSRCFNNVHQICDDGWVDIKDCGADICATVIIDDVAEIKCIAP